MGYSYLAYGLGIASTFRLPELLAGDGKADVEIQHTAALAPGSLAPTVPAAARTGPNEWQLTYDDLGVLTVRNGREIELAPIRGAPPRAVRHAVLGPAMSVLLHQRGFLVLHASVVEIGGRAVAFLADSGAGKSTLAAALHARGHALVADDVAAVRVGPDGPVVYPAFPQLKLWPDAATALGRDAASLPRVEPGYEKRAQRVREGFATHAALPLARLYLLAAGSDVEITPLRPHEAFLALARHAYGIQRMDGVSVVPQFQDRSEVVRRAPVHQLTRPWDLATTAIVVERIERDLESCA